MIYIWRCVRNMMMMMMKAIIVIMVMKMLSSIIKVLMTMPIVNVMMILNQPITKKTCIECAGVCATFNKLFTVLTIGTYLLLTFFLRR